MPGLQLSPRDQASCRLFTPGIDEPSPQHGSQFHVLGCSFVIHLFIRRVQGRETPPSGERHAVGEHAAGVGLDHLGDHVIIWRCVRVILVVELHLDFGAGYGLAVKEHQSLEDVARIIAKGPGQGDNFCLEAKGGVPALFLAKGGDYGLGVMDDEAVLGGLPIGGCLLYTSPSPRD